MTPSIKALERIGTLPGIMMRHGADQGALEVVGHLPARPGRHRSVRVSPTIFGFLSSRSLKMLRLNWDLQLAVVEGGQRHLGQADQVVGSAAFLRC